MNRCRRTGSKSSGRRARAVFPGNRRPSAVLAAQIVRDVADVDQLVGVEVRVIEPSDDDIGARAHVGCDRRLRADILPRVVLNLDRHAGQLGESLRVGLEHDLVAADELDPAQQLQLGPFLRHDPQFGGPGLPGSKNSAGGTCQQTAGTEFEDVPSGEFRHHTVSPIAFLPLRIRLRAGRAFGPSGRERHFVEVAGSDVSCCCDHSRRVVKRSRKGRKGGRA